ncbi:hypothetical protein AMJ80_05390 [bacterium SM23_31]|nr:MAG: hypothetical protein AMJ80_05390 [bacterium SM23_31]
MNIEKSIDKLLDKRKYIFTSIIFASLLVQILFILVLGDFEKHAKPIDYINHYKPGAENILRGKGYVNNDGELILTFSPGYPLYLTLPLFVTNLTGFQDITTIRIFNVFTTVASTIIFFLLVELLFNTRIALFSTFIWMTYPFHLWLIKAPSSEIPFLLFFFGGLWLYFRAIIKDNNAYLVPGIILGCATLIRPIGLLLGLICCIALPLLKRYPVKRQIFRGSIVLIGFFLAIFPWEMLMYVRTGEIIPLRKVEPEEIIPAYAFAIEPGAGGDQASIPDDVMALMLRLSEKKDFESKRAVVSYLMKEFINDPTPVIKLGLIKIARAWYATSSMWYENYILVIQLFYFITIIPGLIIAFKQYREKIHTILFLLSIVMYFWGMTVIAKSILRYMVPVISLLFVFSAIVFDNLVKWGSGRDKESLVS